MRALIITQDEPFFIPGVIDYLVSNRDDDYQIIILKPHLRNKSFGQATIERFKSYTLREFVTIGMK